MSHYIFHAMCIFIFSKMSYTTTIKTNNTKNGTTTTIEHIFILGHSKLKVCFASEKYSKATRLPGRRTHREKIHKIYTSDNGSNFSVFHARNTHHQFNDKSFAI
jgi:hypothetical protein